MVDDVNCLCDCICDSAGEHDTDFDDFERQKARVAKFNLKNDALFAMVMADKEACQEFLDILLPERMIVQSVKTQYSIRNMERHSVVLDVMALDTRGRMVVIEIHPQEDEDHVRRARYQMAAVDWSVLEKQKKYKDIPDIYIIYITEQDFIGQGRGIYTVDRIVRGSEQLLDNGTHEYYINLTGVVNNPVQRELLDYIKDSRPNYKTDQFSGIAKQVDLYKTQKKGVAKMDDILEQERNEGIALGLAKAILTYMNRLGSVPNSIKERIENEKDEKLLNQWMLSAYQSKSIDEFRKNTGL